MTRQFLATANRRPAMSAEMFIALISIALVAFANTSFWRVALHGRGVADWHSWRFVLATSVCIAALHFVFVGLVATRRLVRPLLAIAIVASLIADHYMSRYGIVLDPSMMRNLLQTDPREAVELIDARVGVIALGGLLAASLLWCVPLRAAPPGWSGLSRRIAALCLAVLALAGGLLVAYQDLGSLLRNQRGLRYTINPASLLWALGSVAAAGTEAMVTNRDPPEPVQRRQRVGTGKSIVMVVVVGETARAMNFSLNGYARPTTPELERLDLVNFGAARACGTSTAVSLPCMFSPFGRADYDESRIRRHESLPHVLSRAGFRVVWVDNQSGCKGVCDGLETLDVSRSVVPDLCSGGRCFDEILSRELARLLDAGTGDTVVVLHQIGSHGPAYHRRYPPDSRRFEPACEKDELRECDREQIVNAYDNTIAYTDRFLAGVVRELDGRRDRYDIVMVYASDHGESLGEKGLYLHGIPHAIAPREQLLVPMLWWLPTLTAATLGFDAACFRGKAPRGASHDNLYHTVLGMLGVSTPLYRPERDLVADCRRPAV